jgi:hypothetical protein
MLAKSYHSLKRYFKRTDSRQDLVSFHTLVCVGDKLAVNFEIYPCLRDLVNKNYASLGMLLDSLCHYIRRYISLLFLEKAKIFNINNLFKTYFR